MKELVRIGQVICDGKGKKYLVINVTDKSINCLNEDWCPVYIGLDCISQFYDYENDRDLKGIIEFMKSGQKIETEGKCQLFEICNCKTAMCRAREPDESCYYFRYFKNIINKKTD